MCNAGVLSYFFGLQRCRDIVGSRNFFFIVLIIFYFVCNRRKCVR